MPRNRVSRVPLTGQVGWPAFCVMREKGAAVEGERARKREKRKEGARGGKEREGARVRGGRRERKKTFVCVYGGRADICFCLCEDKLD